MKSLDPGNLAYDSELHLEQVRFERVFDAPGPNGVFSFEAGGRREYGVSFLGSPVPRAGSQFAVVLAERGNWQTVLGCRDLATPDIYLRQTVWQVASDFAWLAYVAVPVVAGMTLAAVGGWAALAVVALSVWAGAAYLRRVLRRSRTIARMLREAPPRVPPGAGRDPDPSWAQRILRALP